MWEFPASARISKNEYRKCAKPELFPIKLTN